MADVFLSYAREDHARAAQVAEGLVAGGYDVFWDVEIPPGATWSDFLEDKLSNCKAAIVLWSKTSTASQWVREEARLAKDRAKLIPVMIDDAAPPFGFGEIQAANLSAWNGEADNAQWKLLLAGVARAVGAGPSSTPSAKPIRPATAGGWDSGRAAPVSAPPAERDKKKPNIPLIIGGAVVATIVVLAIIGSLGGGDVGTNAGNGGGFQPPSVSAGLSPEVQAIVETARSAAQAGGDAMKLAGDHAAQGQQAANAAATGLGGYGTSQGPMGMIAGDLMGLQSGREAPVGIAMSQGTQFFGLMQSLNPQGTAYTMSGNALVPGGAGASGKWQYADGGFVFVGGGAIPNKWSVQTREQGPADGSATTGIGQIRYANGEVYLGEYRAVGEGLQAQVFRNGLGAYYDAKGAVINAGRFVNDAFAGPS